MMRKIVAAALAAAMFAASAATAQEAAMQGAMNPPSVSDQPMADMTEEVDANSQPRQFGELPGFRSVAPAAPGPLEEYVEQGAHVPRASAPQGQKREPENNDIGEPRRELPGFPRFRGNYKTQHVNDGVRTLTNRNGAHAPNDKIVSTSSTTAGRNSAGVQTNIVMNTNTQATKKK